MSQRKQMLVSGVANLGSLASGVTLGFSAVALPAMQAPGHELRVSENEASWIASLVSVGMPVGCLLMGIMLDGLGRRRTLMLVNLPAVVGWLLIATASRSEQWFLYQVYAGRLLTGAASVITTSSATVYVTEVVTTALRGVVAAWAVIAVSLGILVVYVLGAIFKDDWRLVAGICTCFPLAAIIAVWFLVPESPVWLASKGRIEDAEMSMRRIRRVRRDVSLPESLQEELVAMTTSDRRDSNWRDTVRFLKRPEAYKPLLIFNTLFVLQQFSGIFVVIFYTVDVVERMEVQFDGYLATVLVGLMRLFGSVVVSFASRWYGRRLMANISAVGMSLSIGALTAFLTLKHEGVISSAHAWIPITCLMVYLLTCTLGLLTLPFSMLAEVLPTRVRSVGGGALMFLACAYSFVATKLYPNMRTAWGIHNLFAFYTIVTFLGSLFMYFFLPETQGKSLQEVERFFRGSSYTAVAKGEELKEAVTKSAVCDC